MLTRLKECGLKLSPEKCAFMKRSVKFLGHVVVDKGLETECEKVLNYPVLTKPEELRSFIALAGLARLVNHC